jgi:hypothetical protein
VTTAVGDLGCAWTGPTSFEGGCRDRVVESALVTFERFVGTIGRSCANPIPRGDEAPGDRFRYPGGPHAGVVRRLRRYVDGMVASLEVTDDARDLSLGVLHPPSPVPLRPLVGVSRFVTVGLLAERIRAGYGLAWDTRHERMLAALAAGIRAGIPALPDPWRRWPHARDADRRLD